MKTRIIKLAASYLILFLALSVPAQTGGTYTIEQSVIAGGGGQNSAGGQFSLDGTIGQAVAGGAMSGATFSVTSGFWNFTPSVPTAPTYEADVQTRPHGDGYIDSDDIQEIRRFAVGLDKPYQSNEFQRADNSPRSTLGDGYVDAEDVEQARRYSVSLDAKQLAGGSLNSPAAADESGVPADAELQTKQGDKLFGLNLKGASSPAAGRAIRIVSQTSGAGQSVVVPINVDTTGDETGYTFSLSFDQTKLQATAVTIGTLGGNVLSNINNTAGTIGFSVTSFAGAGTIPAATNQTLVSVTFTVASGAGAGTTPLAFTDNPSRRKVSGADPNTGLPQPDFDAGAGTVTITAPTAASVTVSGRAQTQTGRGIRNVVVTIRDAAGNQREARTTSFGYYRFEDVRAGETYVFTAAGKRFRFGQNTQVHSITEDTNNVNFIADEQSLMP